MTTPILSVTRSSIDGWTWAVRHHGKVIDAGPAADRESARREGEGFLRWHRARLDGPIIRRSGGE